MNIIIQKKPVNWLFYISFLLITIQPSFAQQSIASAGKTIVARGEVNAEYDKKMRGLKRRAPVFTLDTVSTGLNSRTQLRMIDGGLLSLKQHSQLNIANYDFNPANKEGAVVMSLIKGGLRTLTGSLVKKDNNYQLSTPVASIGVRGTHYSAHMDKDDLLLAVWVGEIHVQVTVGVNPLQFGLGPKLRYSAARVKANGEVEFLLKTPQLLALGHTQESLLQPLNFPKLANNQALFSAQPLQNNEDKHARTTVLYDQLMDEWVDNEQLVSSLTPTILSRSGTASFGLISHSFTSSVGSLSDAAMNLEVDFDLSRIPTGNLTFTDAAGEWFAAFNGVINESSLDLNINFASHGNNLADGSITGVFVDDGQEIFGDLTLSEISNTSIQAGGGFVLGEVNP